MLAKKNRLLTRAGVGLLLALFVAGCTPSGPRALLNGKKLLDAGDYAGAVEELRTATTLLPGTVILTGTPHGVGMAQKPPRWLKAGDEVAIEIEKIGTLVNPVASEP